MNMIAAAGAAGEIGIDGNLIWRIPADLRRFKELTLGHTVIMGRKTWQSLPKRPLPGRRNIVITRDPAFSAEGAEIAASPEEARRLTEGEEAFVIGGAAIYEAMLPLIDRIFLTQVDARCPDADAYLPPLPTSAHWISEEESEWQTTPDGIRYRYVIFRHS